MKHKMDKIFDPEVQAYLKSTGITDQQIAAIQFDKLEVAVIKRLTYITNQIEAQYYKNVEKMLSYSPAGDYHGAANNYIDFSDIMPAPDHDGVDIGTVIETLRELKNKATTK